MDTYLNNLNRWNISYRCEVVASQAHINDVHLVEKAVFPEKMQDSLSDLKAFFANEEAHGLILRRGNKPVGVLKGLHLGLDNTSSELLYCEELIHKHDVTFYMDSVGILKDVRSTYVLDFLMHEMAIDMRRFGYQYVTAHARVKGGLSRLYRRRYKAKVLASYDDWGGFGETFDYILVDLKNIPVQNAYRHLIYQYIRRLFALVT